MEMIWHGPTQADGHPEVPPGGWQRIACLSTEAVEILYRLGAQDRIVGISGFTVHPPEARHEKPKISGFTSAVPERILAVQPQLVVGFSNLQAPLLDELRSHDAQLATLLFQHSDIAGLMHMVRMLGRLVAREGQAEDLCASLQHTLAQVHACGTRLPRRLKVYFEEWDEPRISGIAWVSEVLTLAGGQDVFADRAAHHVASQRFVQDEEIAARAPELVLGSWCGKKFRANEFAARPALAQLPAVQAWQADPSRGLVEIKSPDILSPGPSLIERGAVSVLAALAAEQGLTLADLGWQGPAPAAIQVFKAGVAGQAEQPE